MNGRRRRQAFLYFRVCAADDLESRYKVS